MNFYISEKAKDAYDKFTFGIREKKKNELVGVYEQIPRLRVLEKEIGLLWVKKIKGEITENECDRQDEALKNELCTLLKANGLSEEKLSDIYYCDKCSDKGFVNGNICSCLVKFSSEYMGKMLLGNVLEKHNFDNFNIDLYNSEPDEKVNKITGGRCSSERELAKYNLSVALNYVKHVSGGNYYSLFISGGVGTGKTFLSHCIAKELIDSGISVSMDTAYNIIEDITDVSLGKKEKEEIEGLYESSVLVIDDLGCERQTDYSQMVLFNLINERITKRKPMIISTNLTAAELKDKYDERILSRIKGEFGGMRTYGRDLRIK